MYVYERVGGYVSDEKKLMKFDVVVGNPPYQEDANNLSGKAKPMYHFFYDMAKKMSDIYCLVTPGRFLFGAGATNKKWNNQMLSDKNIMVLDYVSDGKLFFPGTDIKGGVTILYHDSSKVLGPIGVFTSYKQLNSILKKVNIALGNSNLSDLLYGETSYKYSNLLMTEYKDMPANFITTNALESNPLLFLNDKASSNFVGIYGRIDNVRTYRYIDKKYIVAPDNFEHYKVFLPASNGSGAIGEVLSTPLIGDPLIGDPLIGHTQTFISLGKFDNKLEAENLLKYIKSKFARTMLGVKKVTQHNKSKDVWSCVPLQDFTDKSDIDWSKDIAEIDRQLYKKYGLSEDEIEFIEEKVKPMT